MEIKTSEFFKNIKKLPPPGTDEFNQLINWEEEKIKGGISINGIFISGWLYWHLNHWKIRIDSQDKYGNEIRIESLPELRDNEWIRAEAIERCRVEKKGYMEIGARQGGKSEMEASFFGMNSIMFKLTQNVIVCGNDNDLSLLKDKVDFGLKNVWEGLNIPRLDKTWRSNQIRLGYKKPNGDDDIWSYIVIRNAKDGHNTEVSAGTTAKSFIMDEVGKYAFSQAYEAGVPALKGKNGFRAIPILVGTGGSFTHGKDAENFFYNPNANNFLGFKDEVSGKETCLFLSGLYRQDCKESMTLVEFLRKETNVSLSDISELSKITIQVSNKEKAKQLIESEREAAKKNPDKTIYLKKVMYYPLTVDECFLSDSDNIFDVEAAKRQKQRLVTQERTGTPVILYSDESGIKHQFTDKLPLSNFPLKPTESKDAPIVIYEMPIDNPPYGLYVAGCLLPGEKVLTEKGLQKVENVVLSDKLINKEGEKVEILNLQRYYKKEDDVFRIKISNTYRTTTFTREHPIYVSDSYGNKAEPVIENRFKFEFKETKNIKSGQWIKVPNTYKKNNDFDLDILWNNSSYRKDRNINSPLKNRDFWWFIGLFLGDGWCESTGSKITVVFNKKENLHIERFVKIVNELFNREVSKRIRSGCIELTFGFQQLSHFLTNNFGKYSFGKFVPDWAKRIDNNLKHELVLGYLDSDGCIYHDKKRNYYSFDFVSINQELLEDIQDVLFSLGYVSSLHLLRKEDVRIIGSRKKLSKIKKTYTLRMGHNDTIKFRKFSDYKNSHKLSKIDIDNLPITVKSPKKGAFISECENYIYFKITNIETFKYTGWVYNFECNTNTYLCRNITTHNCDPYRQGKSEYSDSLGSVYIYKRMHDITGEKFQDMIVASYCARPDKKDKWEEQARFLIKYYNARTLCENDDISFIETMKSKNDSHYLEKQPEWLKEIVPNTTVTREYGIHRSSDKIRDFLHNCLKRYLEEVLFEEKDENGNVIKQVLGVHRIMDPMLLEEIIQYNDKEGNFDRIIAFELTLAQVYKMDPIFGKIGKDSNIDSRLKSMKTKKIKQPILFGESKGLFTRRKNKLFA